MLRSLLLYLSERDGPKKLLMGNRLGRRLASRFIAGEEVEDALRVVRQLNRAGFKVTLDYLGESVLEATAAEAACGTYLQLLRSTGGGEVGLPRIREADAIGLGH